ncbi:hypothetical protein ACIPWI_34485 [Streptomyces sp. NPDC090046]|uniref:hypothetical protein n=1 Tax=Streptomyces sp. NPDC090046 TaxID=3365928 RepID=UPI003820B947
MGPAQAGRRVHGPVAADAVEPAPRRPGRLPGAGDGYGVLAIAPPEKKKAANTIENVLQPGTTKAADAADEPTPRTR